MKKFPNEYLTRVFTLLEKKKTNSLKPDEDRKFTASNDILKGYEELRDDQVRIICKHLHGNFYCIVGAFVKKEDMNCKSFYNIARRNINIDISTPALLEEQLEDASKIEERIYDYIEKNARKGNR